MRLTYDQFGALVAASSGDLHRCTIGWATGVSIDGVGNVSGVSVKSLLRRRLVKAVEWVDGVPIQVEITDAGREALSHAWLARQNPKGGL